ncbi:MAG: hypothetical protein JNL98_13030 [Bryobacterales bacterium]|nr:hypothetical protein [Bryobacterales bacterium]
MRRMVEVMVEWGKAGFPRVIRIPIAAAANIAPDYSFFQWRNDPAVEREERQLFRLWAARIPETEDVLPDIQRRLQISEVQWQGRRAEGLLAAVLLDGVALSWETDPVWSAQKVDCTLVQLEGDGCLETQPVSVPNLCRANQVVDLLSMLRPEADSLFRDGASLIESAAQVLPHLRFVGDAPAQLRTWTAAQEGWGFVVRALLQLEQLCAEWRTGQFPNRSLSAPCTPEGERVRNNRGLKAYREFVCEDGKLRFFSWHLKHYALNLRIHYDPDEVGRIVRIGHIGSHLPL